MNEKKKTRRAPAYHRYFEGYAEKQEVDAKTGKEKTKRVYVDWYYWIIMDEKKEQALRKSFAWCFLLGIFAFFATGLLPVASNAGRLMIFANLFELVPLILMALPVYDIATAPRKFEVRIYKQFHAMHLGAILAAFGFGFGCLSTLGILLVNRQQIPLEMLAVLLQGTGCAAMFYIQRKEGRLVFDRRKSEETLEGESYIIN